MARHPQRDLYESTLVEIGRITTTWAKFEHWVDVAIWYLADVEDRRGACITTQLGSIHAKFRALEALMVEAGRPEPILKIIRGIAGEAAEVVKTRNKFAHGPLDMDVNKETREFEVYLKHISVKGKGVLTLESEVLTTSELETAQAKVAGVYQKLIKHWYEIIDIPSAEELAR
ncbi:MAG: hypothetical protein AB7S46_11910 [Flavobacteriaceae bacterium]